MLKHRYIEHSALRLAALRLTGIIGIAALICLLAAEGGHAASLSGEMAPDEPWHIAADTITYDPAEAAYIAEGNVVITHLDRRLTADRVQFRNDEKVVHASGNVFFSANGDAIDGDRLTFNMAEETGTLYTGHIFIEENNFHITGDRIVKTGEKTYFIKQGCLTTCEPENPDWSITGADVNVTVEGYGTVKHAAFRVRDVPVLYVPYFIFPAKTKRQSGLLFPHMGYSSKNGAEYIQPYFWAITDHTDATFYYHHIQNRGEKAGVEYRYRLSENSRGTVMFDGLEDRQVDDDPNDPDREWGYTDDRFLRPNAERYWFRMKADQELPADVMARLDLDIVSDQDYLRDFDHGYTGHHHTNQQFESAFDRGIDDRNERVRDNRLNLNRTWTASSVNADILWYDDVVRRREFEVVSGPPLDENRTLQRLPMLTYTALKQPVYQNSVYGSLNTEYNYFFREDGVTGHRADMHPRLFFPFHPTRHLTLEPYAGYRQTVWYTDADREDIATDPKIEEDLDRYAHREIYDIGADLSTEMHRIYPVSVFGLEKIKHGIVPNIGYSYIPLVDQSEYPDFDEIDRIEKENQMIFSITHFFTSKRIIEKPDADPEPAYNQFARFMIEQPYDFAYEEKDEAFRPIYAELDITPVRMFTLHADTLYSHSENTVTSSNTSVRLRNLGGFDFRVDYRYTRDRNKTLYFKTKIPVRNWLTLYGDYERSLVDHRDVELNAGIEYKTDCWSADFSYRVQQALDGKKDEQYFFLVHLYGLGEFGN